jgi:predicted acetyltransferase
MKVMTIPKNPIVVRHLKQEEIEQSMRLGSYAFQYEIPEEEWETALNKEVPEEVWGGFDGDVLAAQVRVRPFHMYLNGQIIKMGGIAAVSAWPEHRRGGIVASILIRTLSVMKEAGQTISLLGPFSYAFYRKFGWEMAIDRKRLTLEPELFTKIDPSLAPGNVIRVGSDIALLSSIYEQYATLFNGMLHRTHAWTVELLERRKGHIAVYHDVQGVPQGYVHYEIKNNEFLIHELITLNHEAQLGLWRFIANHDSMVDQVVYMAPADDALPYLLDNPRIKQQIEPYFMARIVDLEKLVEQYKFLPSVDRIARWADNNSISVFLHIKDQHAQWNDGLWKLTVASDGSASISRVELDQQAAVRALSCDIQTLSSLLMGYMRASHLYDIRRLQGDREQSQILGHS